MPEVSVACAMCGGPFDSIEDWTLSCSCSHLFCTFSDMNHVQLMIPLIVSLKLK